MKSESVTIAVFSGTGNTLIAANALADSLRAGGKQVSMIPMDHPEQPTHPVHSLPANAALGLAVPVAAFSSYPTVWRFIDSLPEGNGRETFLLATMAGMGFTMHAPIGSALQKKGYTLIAHKNIRMCGNYGAKTPQGDKLAAILAKAKKEAAEFGEALLADRAHWGSGWYNPLSRLFAWTAKTGRSFKTFRHAVPLAANAEKCTACALCARQCPTQAITMTNGEKPAAVLNGNLCQSCQRCIAYCPAKAIGVPGKEVRQHRAVPPETMAKFLEP